jgi:hypothetical protein
MLFLMLCIARILQDRGVDFPVRPQAAAEAASGAPYYTPPPMPAAEAAAAQGISPEDRAAIAAAVADLEAQVLNNSVQRITMTHKYTHCISVSSSPGTIMI